MNTTELDEIISQGNPVPALEHLIAKNGRAAVRYAFLCLKGPFPAAEPTISRDADWSYEYAVYVLQGRFPAGEAAIARNETNQTMYAEFLTNSQHPENRAFNGRDWPASVKHGLKHAQTQAGRNSCKNVLR